MGFNYKAMLSRVTEFGGDPLQLMEKAEAIRVAALCDGVASDKVSVKDGIMEVVERNPATALQAVRLMFDITKWLTMQAEANSEESTECRLVITGLDMTPPKEIQRYG